MKLPLLFLLLISFFTRAQENPPLRILFVGNSLTYANDLPGLVQELAGKKKLKVITEMLAKPNYALEDHLMDGALQHLIATERFDFVVVQQGPSSQVEGREMLMRDGAKINQLCDQYGTRLAFYMVWPSRQYYQSFDGVIKNYSDVATSTQAILCPVGQTWKAYQDSTADFSYYDHDGFHPSRLGSQVAAQVILASLLAEWDK